jgi:N-acyl-L-homoserine lactone synthetase
MIIVIDRHNIAEHSRLVAEMFRLRARIFGGRLGWSVQITEGLERDRFDDENPVYVIDTADGEHVRGSLRLLPTTGPTLFRDVFADTVTDAAEFSSPAIWECTRFCVEEDCPPEARVDHLARTSGALIAALGEIGLRAGIESYLGNFDASMIRIYRRLGCAVDILGQTDKYGRRVYLGLFPVSADILQRVKSKLASIDAGGGLEVPRNAAEAAVDQSNAIAAASASVV